jgi:hypothetical protein
VVERAALPAADCKNIVAADAAIPMEMNIR